MPRRSGTTTVWSFASTAAIGDHMSPVLPKPWISTTAGPWPPTRTLIVASVFTTCELRKSAGKGVGAACADTAPSATPAARPAATRRKRRENVDGTVADMLGSLGYKTDGDVDVAAGGLGINTRLVGGVDQGLGSFVPDARQADVEANLNEIGPVGIAQVDLSVDGQVGRQCDLHFSCLKLHRADETGRPARGEKLF